MQFDDLKNEVKGVAIDDLREDSENYFEAVVTKDELANLTSRLEEFLGPPIRSSKTSLSAKIKDTIREFGGIQPGQTLYLFQQDSETVFAMLWPWSDRNHTTLKIVRQKQG